MIASLILLVDGDIFHYVKVGAVDKHVIVAPTPAMAAFPVWESVVPDRELLLVRILVAKNVNESLV